MSTNLANHEVVVIAVYMLAGDTKRIDTEDVAIKANEIAPGRFNWRKYPDQINIESVRKRLWDAKKESKGGLLSGSEREGWLLTKNGVDFAKLHHGNYAESDFARNRLSLTEKQWLRGEHDRLLSEPAFLKYEAGEVDTINNREAEAFFRLNDYIIGKTREEKVQRILNAFSEDSMLGKLVKELAIKVLAR